MFIFSSHFSFFDHFKLVFMRCALCQRCVGLQGARSGRLCRPSSCRDAAGGAEGRRGGARRPPGQAGGHQGTLLLSPGGLVCSPCW